MGAEAWFVNRADGRENVYFHVKPVYVCMYACMYVCVCARAYACTCTYDVHVNAFECACNHGCAQNKAMQAVERSSTCAYRRRA